MENCALLILGKKERHVGAASVAGEKDEEVPSNVHGSSAVSASATGDCELYPEKIKQCKEGQDLLQCSEGEERLQEALEAIDAAVHECIRVRTGISSQYFYRSMYAAQLHRCFQVSNRDMQMVLICLYVCCFYGVVLCGVMWYGYLLNLPTLCYACAQPTVYPPEPGTGRAQRSLEAEAGPR
jgi:hypothetical protein